MHDFGMQTHVGSYSGLNLLMTHTVHFCDTDLIFKFTLEIIDIHLVFIGIICHKMPT